MLEGPITDTINAFLSTRGLELNKEKTCVTNIRVGFNFVGFHFKRYLYRKNPRGTVLLIKPAPKNVQKLKEKLKVFFKEHKNLTRYQLVKLLNPILMGWSRYYNKVVRSKTFKKISHYV
jgi:RNA-directed DNA polymerase